MTRKLQKIQTVTTERTEEGSYGNFARYKFIFFNAVSVIAHTLCMPYRNLTSLFTNTATRRIPPRSSNTQFRNVTSVYAIRVGTK